MLGGMALSFASWPSSPTLARSVSPVAQLCTKTSAI
jgi:hypothetical protein